MSGGLFKTSPGSADKFNRREKSNSWRNHDHCKQTGSRFRTSIETFGVGTDPTSWGTKGEGSNGGTPCSVGKKDGLPQKNGERPKNEGSRDPDQGGIRGKLSLKSTRSCLPQSWRHARETRRKREIRCVETLDQLGKVRVGGSTHVR